MPHGHVVHFETSAHFRFDAVLEVKLEELVELHDADHRVLLPAYLLELLLQVGRVFDVISMTSGHFGNNFISLAVKIKKSSWRRI